MAVSTAGVVSSGSLRRDCVMSERSRWFPLITILSLLATGVLAPAVARDSVNTFGMARFPSTFSTHMARAPIRANTVTPRALARHVAIWHDLHIHRHTQLRNGLPVVTWPYSSSVAAIPMDVPPVQNEGPSNPQVIVMSQLPNRALEQTAPETPPDYGYIAGCRAIPNGYHCDIPHYGVPASPGG